MTTQTEQMEAFPLTQLDIANAFLTHFETEVEKTTKAMFNAQAKVAEALKLREMAEHEVARHAGESVNPAAAAAAEMKRHAEEAGIGVTLQMNDEEPIVITKAPAVDPITGEVAPAVVVALYPGDGDGHETQVGDRTRYGELVADYFTAVGRHDEHAEDWEVRAVRELQDGGGYRSLHDIITPADYGQELLVVALEQGSVTGAPAEKVAT